MHNFKEKFSFAIAKDRARAWLAITVILICALTPIMILTDASVGDMVFVDVVMAFIAFWVVLMAYVNLMNPPVLALHNECDPYPLVERCDVLRRYINRGNNGMQVISNYAAALACCGEAENAYDALKSFDVDANAGVVPTTRLMYYSNLSSVCDLLGKHEEAEVWYERAAKIYSGIKSQKLKQMFISTYLNNEGDHLMRLGEYALALNKYSGVFPDNRCAEAIKAYNCARAYEAMGNVERARQNANVAIGLGNKLAIVRLACALLERLELTSSENNEQESV